ncbi:hypothetical protein [Millisia brevis]|uniref:hypothetical protein n=1 Tax=Millisia brevis TaxID=264148 RepID=UPI000832CF96|nr:hypothetical protein [Millisia brevis]
MEILRPARLQPYRDYWAEMAGGAPADTASLGALYIWQVTISSSWYEVLCQTEVLVRNVLDSQLREWNGAACRKPDWLREPAVPLERILGSRVLMGLKHDAVRAQRNRATPDPEGGPHPRRNHVVTQDDLVAQLTFGNLVNLLPSDPPTENGRRRLQSGYTAREHLWRDAMSLAFPFVGDMMADFAYRSAEHRRQLPAEVAAGYLISAALDRLRRVRNRIAHHEQVLRVDHRRRHADALFVLRSIDPRIGDEVAEMSRVRTVWDGRPRPRHV